jgi:hypothetical protein
MNDRETQNNAPAAARRARARRSFAGIMTGAGGRKAHVRHEAAPFHHAARRRSSFVAGRGARAGADAALGAGRADEPSPYLESMRAGMRELGWSEGRNLTIGRFWATGLDNMEAAARELLASDPEVIVAQEFTVLALRSLKTAKPVWARPGGNFTGRSYLAIELVGKRIELLKEWLPQTRRIAVLARPQHPGEHLERKASEEVVAKLGIELSYFPYTSRSFLPRAYLKQFGPTGQRNETARGRKASSAFVSPCLQRPPHLQRSNAWILA